MKRIHPGVRKYAKTTIKTKELNYYPALSKEFPLALRDPSEARILLRKNCLILFYLITVHWSDDEMPGKFFDGEKFRHFPAISFSRWGKGQSVQSGKIGLRLSFLVFYAQRRVFWYIIDPILKEVISGNRHIFTKMCSFAYFCWRKQNFKFQKKFWFEMCTFMMSYFGENFSI